MTNPEKNYDLVVAGAGIGGLCAARTAQEAGASVLVLEKASRIGGSAAASGGTVWCARNIDEWLKVQPGGNADLGQALIDGFTEGIPWLETGSIACDTSLKAIQTADGQITGVTVGAVGHDATIETQSLVLATGGFQANPKLRARYMGRWSDRMIVRGVPENTGDGFEAALAIGAQATGPFSRFYGHYLPAPPAKIGLHNFVLVKPDFSEYAITVNLRGERFDDEFLGDEVAVHSLIHQPEATGVLIFDHHIRRNMERYSQWPTADVDRVRNIQDAGGQVLESVSITELADQIAQNWSVPKDRLLATVYQYNDACQKKDGMALPILKSGGLVPIEEAPFYAIRVVAGATFTYGGVKVNTRSEVLDGADRHIRGLYAAGADCGGIYTRGYTGGLCMGLAFGRIAGRSAAAYVKAENG